MPTLVAHLTKEYFYRYICGHPCYNVDDYHKLGCAALMLAIKVIFCLHSFAKGEKFLLKDLKSC